MSSPTDFEPVYATLFATSAALFGFNLTRRRWKHWNDVNDSDFPCLFQVQADEINLEKRRGVPGKWELHPIQWLYVYAGNDETTDPSMLLNPMIGSIRAIYPQGGQDFQIQTLDGLVSHCWINKVEMMEGVLGPKEVAAIHFDILLTSV